MGLFGKIAELLERKEEPENSVQASDKTLIDRRSIPAEEIDQMQRIEASEKYRKKVYQMFYRGYPEMPYISKDRELNTDWLSQSVMFSGQTVEKRMMKRYSDGLLPGHVYMLYWLNKYGSKRRIPAYFEYDYGIDFCKEKRFLVSKGLLGEDDKPTELGLAAIKKHEDVIQERHPAPKKSGPPPVAAPVQGHSDRSIPSVAKPEKECIQDADIPLLREEFKYINEVLRFACKLAGVREPIAIDTTRFAYGSDVGGTYYEWTQCTPSGKPAKYPLTLHYAYEAGDSLLNECFGELHYLQSGKIGKARLIFWYKGVGYFFYLGQTKNRISIKKVEKSAGANRVVLYKENE